MNQAFIQLQELSRCYRDGGRQYPVLKGVNLTIEPGEKIALLGRSGSGKSTLLNLIAGIDLPDAGSVLVNGVNLTQMSESERTRFRRRHIGFVYQFFNLVPGLTARENIEFILELNGFTAEAMAHKTDSLLERIGLLEQGGLFPGQLSGGEQQRIAIARALVHHPQIILADEPTGNLDATTGTAMLNLLGELLDSHSSTLLLVTHSLAVAKTAKRIITLEEGEIVEREGEFAW